MNRKIAENLKNSPDACMRLATQYMEYAMKAAKRGDTVDFCTCVRLAASFEQKIDRTIRIGW